MANSNVVDMTQCPYCRENWIIEEQDLVCERCAPALNVDLAIGEILVAVEELTKLPASEVKAKIKHLHHAQSKLQYLIDEVNPKSGKGYVPPT